MSFITQTIGRRATAVIPRVVTQAPRFSTTTRLQKGPVDAAKDGLKTVDRAVSDKLVDGIDVAADAGSKVKETAAKVTQGNKGVGAKTEELKGEAKATAAKVEGKAKATAEDIKNKL